MDTVLSRSWNLLALRGALALLLGMSALLWQGMPLSALVLVFGTYALLDGIAALAIGTRNIAREHAWLVLLEGLAGIGLGLALLVWTRAAAEPTVLVIALWGLSTGILELVMVTRLRRDLLSELSLAAAGIVSVLLGMAILLWPGSSAVGLVLLLGCYGLMFGASLLIQALRLRRHFHGVRARDQQLGPRPRAA